MMRVTLHAARSREFPDGSIRHGYEFIAPLDTDGRIDLESWKERRRECFALRFWGDEKRLKGVIAHVAGGPRGSSWAFEWDQGGEGEEQGYRFGEHAFAVGEYVSVRELDGELLTFRVASVTPR